jgi:hypothetical protein
MTSGESTTGPKLRLARPTFARRRPIKATSSIVLAVALMMTGCTTPKRVPNVATKSITVPISFVDVSGNAISAKDRPVNATAMLGVIPGGVFGAPHYSLQTERLGKILTLPINLSDLRAALNDQSATLTDDAETAGWRIDPADTRFARVATTITHEGTSGLMVGFVDSASKSNLLLVFFDRPCRLTGTVVVHAREGQTTTFMIDVIVEKAGLNWLKMTGDSQGHDVITNTQVPANPLFVVAPVENLKQRLIQIR